ncbi:hypothetical protein [Streptomyces cyaneofuscatus]|uniref:hypothetical protein n=1 Tax=Streptomyces cyaneofuscatus TaxID=66883 RepID=UPI0036DA6C4F
MTFQDELLAAMRPDDPAIRSVQIEDEDGLHVMLYRTVEGGPHQDAGTVILPRALLDD